MARKNAKSAIIADLLLGFLVGPLRFAGFRAGVVSLNLAKASELHKQMQDIYSASGLSGLQFLAWPRLTVKSRIVEVSKFSRLIALAACLRPLIFRLWMSLGLLRERDRELINSMRSAVSAKGGKFIALTVHGDGPFVPEILKRDGDPGLAIHLYQAAADCSLDDSAAWRAANPGLSCGIKRRSYMESESRRVSVTVSDESSFRALDLNQPVSPTSEMIFSVSDWLKCVVPISDLPDRTGRVFIGFDLGGSSSLTALAALFENGRVEVWAACPSVPDLAERSRVDGADYALMEKRGELRTYAGRVTPVGEFLKNCASRLGDCRVIAAGADRYRKAEAMQALDDATLRWPLVWRGMGASSKADGSHDVRALQKRVLSRSLFMAENLLMTSAIKNSVIRRDASGNPALDKGKQRGRIDPLSALVIASGLSELEAVRPRRTYRSLGTIG